MNPSHSTWGSPLLASLLFSFSACSSPAPSGVVTQDAAAPDATSHDAARGPDAQNPPPDGAVEVDAGPGVGCTGASPSFASDVTPIFERSCGGGEFCHAGIDPKPWAYAKVVNVAALRNACDPSAVFVTPGNLEKSYLVHKVTGVGMCPGTSQMPRGTAALPAADIQTIADWVCAGAKNN